MTPARLVIGILAAFVLGFLALVYHQTQAMRGLIADFRTSIEATIVEAYK